MSRRVLVVDDDHDIQELARMWLKLIGGPTDTADSGTAALTVLERDELPNAVLPDAIMPRLDGLSLVCWLWQSKRTRTLPVVLLAARNLSSEVDLHQPGIRGALSKPFDPMTRATQVSKLLGWSGSRSR